MDIYLVLFMFSIVSMMIWFAVERLEKNISYFWVKAQFVSSFLGFGIVIMAMLFGVLDFVEGFNGCIALAVIWMAIVAIGSIIYLIRSRR